MQQNGLRYNVIGTAAKGCGGAENEEETKKQGKNETG